MKVLIIMILVLSQLEARELYPGQWANSDPERQEWFRSQKIPGSDNSCCTLADGTTAMEDIIDGEYWVNFEIPHPDKDMPPIEVGWQRVPTNTIIHNSKAKYGPVVWYTPYWKPGGKILDKILIRCFVPGAKS